MLAPAPRLVAGAVASYPDHVKAGAGDGRPSRKRVKTRQRTKEQTMPQVTVAGESTFEAPDGKRLVLAIEDAGIDIMHKCGGNARCTTCRVQVLEGDPGPMGELERERLSREEALPPDVRLSCQIRVHSDLTVNVLGRSSLAGIPAGPRPED
jgi:ferredoxin